MIRAKMMAAKEETDEAAKALKELIVGLGNLAPKALKPLRGDFGAFRSPKRPPR